MSKGMKVVAGRCAIAAAVLGLAGQSMAASYTLNVADTFAGSGKIIVGTTTTVTGSVSKTGSGSFTYTGLQVTDTHNGVTTFVAGPSGSVNNNGSVASSTLTPGVGTHTYTVSVASFTGSPTNGGGTLTDTLTVYDHADAQFAAGSFSSYSNGPGAAVTPSQTLSSGNHSLAVDFGTVWASAGSDPYPVYAYFDITNPLATAVSVSLSALTGGATVTPDGTSPTWALESATGGAFAPGTLAAGGVYKARIAFNSNDPSLYLPGSPFAAAWDISMLEDQTITGHSTTAQVLRLSALAAAAGTPAGSPAVAVPLPASAAMGSAALGLLGAVKTLRARRARA